jgi:hypothetical protein
MDEMYRMLGREREAELLREAERLQRPVALGLAPTPKGWLRALQRFGAAAHEEVPAARPDAERAPRADDTVGSPASRLS